MDSMNILDKYIDDKVAMYNGDSCEIMKMIPSDSMDLSVFSPPFSSLYTYSNSDRDLGNSKTDDEFFMHFSFIIKELYRIMKPGRIVGIHCMNLPASKERDGYIGIKDFRGDLIRAFQSVGFIYHAEVCIWKNPVTAMQRTKALGLLHKQIKKDSCMSRMGIPDYVVFMRKRGENPDRVTHTNESYPVSEWQNVASPIWDELNSPVWWDINQSDTLNARAALDEESERHICFAEGTMVLTKRGYVPIETIIAKEDEVLTNSGEWHTVVGKLKTACNTDVVRVKAVGAPMLVCTPDHKFMGKTSYGSHPKDNLCRVDDDWINAENAKGTYLKSVLPPVIESNISETEWWIIGRWIADGHVDCRGKQFFISVGNNKLPEFEEKASEYIGHRSVNGNCTQIGLKGLSEETRAILKKCGKHALDKVLPFECISLNEKLSKALYEGYRSGDGHIMADGKESFTSVSRGLLLGMAIVARKATGKIAAVYHGRNAKKTTIQGREVNTHDEWIMTVSPHYGFSYSDETADYKKVKKVDDFGKSDVWSIEVDTDHSYMVEGVVAKNCPLQLPVIERVIKLYSNEGDTVFTPFMGIGSEVYQAVKMGRKGIGIELKPAYFQTAVKNVQDIEQEQSNPTLFDFM